MGLLSGKVAVVTGGAQGIGLAIAKRYAGEGARLVLGDVNKAAADAAAGELGGDAVARAAVCDVTSYAQVEDLVRAAVDAFGSLDILVNNAGITRDATMKNMTEEMFDQVIGVHLRGCWNGTKVASLRMREQGTGGAIVNISSISALRPRGLTTYTTSKAAVIGLTRAMAVDHGSDNIRVNCICPGPMYTPMVYARGMSEAARANRAKASVLKLEGTGWDIGHAVRFLLSNHARYVTGQVLVIDGGVTLQAPERESEDH